MKDEKTIERNKYLLWLLVISALIILLASLEAFMMAKSVEFYQAFLEVNPDSNFSQFISMVLFQYLFNVIEPIIISLYTYFTIHKGGINFYYRLIFGAAIIIRLINLVLQFRFQSIFYYLLILLFILLFIVVVKIPYSKK